MSIIPAGVTKQVFRSALKLKKHSPNIMFAGGVGGVIVSTVLACRATLKLSEAMPEMKGDLEAIRSTIEDPDERNRALALAYGMNASRVIKLYGPPVVIGGAAIGLLTGSHVQLTRRNAGLTMGYAAVSEAFEQYRERAQGVLGKDAELDLYHAATTEKIKDAEGKTVSVKVIDQDAKNMYGRFFDESARNFEKNAEQNRAFLRCNQIYANDILLSKGHLFLNEVYDMLGFERTKAGSVVGWILNENSDNFVDFGLYEVRNKDFVNGFERVAFLDFNVDGVIYDKLGD